MKASSRGRILSKNYGGEKLPSRSQSHSIRFMKAMVPQKVFASSLQGMPLIQIQADPRLLQRFHDQPGARADGGRAQVMQTQAIGHGPHDAESRVRAPVVLLLRNLCPFLPESI